MDNENKEIISQEDMADCLDFVADFCDELGKYEHRITASEDEHACARAIRNRLHDETDAHTRLEAFGAHALLGRGMFLFMGLWMLVCYVVYYISFAGSKYVALFTTLLALVMFVAGNAVLISLFFGRETFKKLLPQKVCYNVVSEYSKQDKGGERVFIICDNHDGKLGSPIKDFDNFRSVCTIIEPLSMLVFVVFCILKMAFGIHDGDIVAKISAFTLVPTIFGVFGVTAFLLHYSPHPHHARKKNDAPTAVAMATYAYFLDNDLLDDDTKLVYVSFGAENSAHCGSKAFVSAHPEYSGATVLCIGDVKNSEFEIAEYDAMRKIEFSTDVVAKVLATASEQGIDAKIMPHNTFMQKICSMHGYMSNAFAKGGIKTTTILSKKHSKQPRNLEMKDIENLFTLSVCSLQKLMKTNPSKDASQDIADAQ